MTSIDFLNKVHKILDSQEYNLSYSPAKSKNYMLYCNGNFIGGQTGEAFLPLPGQPETDTAAPNLLDFISGPFHQNKKFIQIGGAFGQCGINGKAQSVLIGKRPFPVFLPLPIVPVSYTHLDVYKRQGQYVVQQIFRIQKLHRQDAFR